MNLTDSAYQAFKTHVLTDYPNEAVGLVVNDVYVPCKNTSKTPEKQFRIDPKDLVSASKIGSVQAILHSHTYGPDDRPYENGNQPQWPSSADMASWMKGDVPWGIVATDGEGLSEMVWMDDSVIPPLLERPFVHGVTDCGAIIRDYFRLKGINLKNYPRGYEWWEKGGNLYVDNWTDAGFIEITEPEAGVGDVVIMQIRSPVPNHAAVITAENTITHHLFHRLSEEDRLDKWRKVIVKYLRYDKT